MQTTKLALVVGAMTLAFTGLAHAQGADPWDLKERMGIFVDDSGKAKLMRMTDTGHATIMREGRALPAGAIVYRSGGKLYLLEDKKMSDGKMMFDKAGDWMFSGT